jgi:hypothetical protein
VRAQQLDGEIAFMGCLAHQLEVALLDVAKAAVQGLTRARGRAAGQIAGLE